MKRNFFKGVILVTLFIAFSLPGAEAQQTAKQIEKERKAVAKMTKSQINEKASKSARKEAKKMTKQGWLITPGALPLDKQLEKSYQLQYEIDENLFPKYITGEAMSIAENFDAGKMQALELAKQNLAGQIQTTVTALIENSVANRQLASEQASSITESVLAAKNVISQEIGRVIPVVEAYRVLGNKNREVYVRIAYNAEMALEVTKKAIKQDLEQKGNKLHEQLDKVLGF
jgi:hypothetical protein